MEVKLTEKETVELKYNYYLGYKYIARNEIGTLKFFKEKPVRYKESVGKMQTGSYDTWVIGSYPIKDHSLYADVKLGAYNFITWENGVWDVSELI